jgi:hypothetical protein
MDEKDREMGIDYRSLYGKEWLGAWDIPDSKDVTVTITAVAAGELTSVGGKKSKKPVISVRGSPKKLAVNATNGRTIATMYGKNIEGWVGKKITLYKSTTRDPSSGGETECVRIRPQVPAAKPQSAEETLAPSSTESSADLGAGGAI